LRDRRGHPIREVLAQPKRVALLVYLVMDGGLVPRDRLLALFWPESDSAHARNTLSQALHQLRQALGPDVIESRGATAVGVRGEQIWCDATEFSTALERGDAELALDLYRGEFCPTLFASGAPELDEWLDTQRRKLRAQALAAARTVAERLAADGSPEHAARAARRALAMLPDDEADVRALLSLLEQSGDLNGALVAYQEYERRLAAALETEPAPETKRLVEEMRRRREQQPTPEVGPLPPLPRGERRRSPLPARRRAPIVALALALLTIVGAVTVLWRGTRRTGPPVKTLAVLPFTLRGGAPLAYLRDGMVDLMSA